MGIISGLMGHASKIADMASVKKEFAPILVDGETVVAAYRLVRDQYVFTDKRLVIVDRQGLTGRKVEYLTVPYSRISCFAKESAGLLDLDAELKIWISGRPEPLVTEFRSDSCVNEIYNLLSQAVVG